MVPIVPVNPSPLWRSSVKSDGECGCLNVGEDGERYSKLVSIATNKIGSLNERTVFLKLNNKAVHSNGSQNDQSMCSTFTLHPPRKNLPSSKLTCGKKSTPKQGSWPKVTMYS